MASRIRDVSSTAARYENRENYDPQASGGLARLNTDVVIDTGINSLINSLDTFITASKNQISKETMRKAQINGATAGLASDYQPRQDNTDAAEVYNRAGNQIYLNGLSVELSTKLSGLETRPELAADPVKMSHALEDIETEFNKTVPMEIYPDFKSDFDARAERLRSQASANSFQSRLEENKNVFEQSEANFISSASKSAREGDEELLAKTQSNYFKSLDNQLGLGLTAPQVEQRKLIFNKQVRSDAVIGEFLRVPDDEKHVFVSSFMDNNPLVDILSPSEIEDLKKDMMTAWDVEDNNKEQATQQKHELNKTTADDTLFQFFKSPDIKAYNSYATMEGATPEQVAVVKDHLGGKITTNPIAKNEVEKMIYSGDYNGARDYLLDPISGLSMVAGKDIARYGEMISKAADSSGFETMDSYQQVLAKIDEDFGVTTGFGLELNDEGRAVRKQIYDKLQKDYPKYEAGELEFDDVDPMRMYKLKRKNVELEYGQADGKQLKTSKGLVVIPGKYMSNPMDFYNDMKTVGIDPRLNNREVKDFMAREIVNLEKQKAKENGK